MAKYIHYTEEQRRLLGGWLAGRPQCIKDIAEKIPPDRLYLLKTTGQRVTLRSYCEDGTVTINVGDEYNQVAFERDVFGINPADLEECDLP